MVRASGRSASPARAARDAARPGAPAGRAAAGGRRAPGARGAARARATARRRDRVDPLPHGGVRRLARAAPARGSAQQLVHLPAEPARRVDAVGDAGDRHLVQRQAGPQPAATSAARCRRAASPTPLAKPEVRSASGVMPNGGVGLVGVLGQRREVPPGHADRRGERPQVAARQVGSNISLPAGTGVWVVKTVEASTSSRASATSGPPRDQGPHPLQREERRVALVHVEDGRRASRRRPARGRRRRRAGSPGGSACSRSPP